MKLRESVLSVNVTTSRKYLPFPHWGFSKVIVFPDQFVQSYWWRLLGAWQRNGHLQLISCWPQSLVSPQSFLPLKTKSNHGRLSKLSPSFSRFFFQLKAWSAIADWLKHFQTITSVGGTKLAECSKSTMACFMRTNKLNNATPCAVHMRKCRKCFMCLANHWKGYAVAIETL